eukprot:25350-Pyramimonas_sp.AAC.1
MPCWRPHNLRGNVPRVRFESPRQSRRGRRPRAGGCGRPPGPPTLRTTCVRAKRGALTIRGCPQVPGYCGHREGVGVPSEANGHLHYFMSELWRDDARPPAQEVDLG